MVLDNTGVIVKPKPTINKLTDEEVWIKLFAACIIKNNEGIGYIANLADEAFVQFKERFGDE